MQMGRRARNCGTSAHALGIEGRRWRREIGEEGRRGKDGDAPEEAFTGAVEGGIRVRG